MAGRRCRLHAGGAVLAALLAACCCLSAAAASASASPQQQDPTMHAEGGRIELRLLASYADGVAAPAVPPQLVAARVLGKGVDCQRNATDARSVLGGVALTGAALAAVPLPAAARCGSQQQPLQGGLYTLQASRVEGANWAAWQCFGRALPAAGGVATASTAASNGSQAVVMFSQTAQLTGGSSFTCVATYTKETDAQAAATAAISWPKMVDAAAQTVGISASCRKPQYKQPPRGRPAAPLRVQGRNLVAVDAATKKSTPMRIRGLNWFGFNVAMGMVDGLWAGGTEAATDFGLIAYQIKMLGYNAVRLPFTHKNLANTQVWDLERECTDVSPQQLKRRLVDPHTVSAAANKALPRNPSPLANTESKRCNTYLPKRMNKDRLLFVLQAFIAQGMYVVLDYQPMGTEDHAFDLNQFVSAWSALWHDVMCLPNFNRDIANRVLIDVMNEPDSMGIRWEAQGNRPGAEQLYLATADALWKASPNKVLFMFEGTGQNMFGLNWGNGFITDESIINSRGLSNPNSFFRQLVTKPYARKAAIISPHVYPPTITKSTFLGASLWEQCNKAFGYLQTQGFCTNGKCTKFPVLVGETGSAYTDATDKTWLVDFADYVMARGAARAFNKAPLAGWMWWAYNENSGDTGGIVTNNWQDLHWEKLRYMMQKLGLRPWYHAAVHRANAPAPAASTPKPPVASKQPTPRPISRPARPAPAPAAPARGGRAGTHRNPPASSHGARPPARNVGVRRPAPTPTPVTARRPVPVPAPAVHRRRPVDRSEGRVPPQRAAGSRDAQQDAHRPTSAVPRRGAGPHAAARRVPRQQTRRLRPQ